MTTTDAPTERGGSLRGAVFCGAPAGLPIHPEIGTPAGEMLPLLLLLGLFGGAAVWMFRRFGASAPAAGPAAGEGSGEPGDARQGALGREPVPAGA